eukprot:m.132963 g.132963  ORF g.132963 m.132963 type:complete len:146 (-) comp14659_c0_seq4:993-1430(-)
MSELVSLSCSDSLALSEELAESASESEQDKETSSDIYTTDKHVAAEVSLYGSASYASSNPGLHYTTSNDLHSYAHTVAQSSLLHKDKAKSDIDGALEPTIPLIPHVEPNNDRCALPVVTRDISASSVSSFFQSLDPTESPFGNVI